MNILEHLFTCLTEEACEIGQAAAKVNRFAIDGCYPDGRNNVSVVSQELADLIGVIDLINEEFEKIGIDNLIYADTVQIEAKKEKVLRHMELARQRGSLND